MITLEDIKHKLPPLCEVYGIAYVDAFGSMARRDQSDDSDIDLIIEFAEPRREQISLRFFGFLHAIEEAFDKNVDLLTERSIVNPYLKERINQERVRLYGS